MHVGTGFALSRPHHIEYLHKGLGLTPKQLVDALDDRIVGQAAAKRALAVAVRDRCRRATLDEEIRREISPVRFGYPDEST